MLQTKSVVYRIHEMILQAAKVAKEKTFQAVIHGPTKCDSFCSAWCCDGTRAEQSSRAEKKYAKEGRETIERSTAPLPKPSSGLTSSPVHGFWRCQDPVQETGKDLPGQLKAEWHWNWPKTPNNEKQYDAFPKFGHSSAWKQVHHLQGRRRTHWQFYTCQYQCN